MSSSEKKTSKVIIIGSMDCHGRNAIEKALLSVNVDDIDFTICQTIEEARNKGFEYSFDLSKESIESLRQLTNSKLVEQSMIMKKSFKSIDEPKSGRENRRDRRAKNRIDKYGNKRK